MMRLALFAVCFTAATASLVYTFVIAPSAPQPDINEVSRANPDFLTLQPALAPVTPAEPQIVAAQSVPRDPTRPVARPAGLAEPMQAATPIAPAAEVETATIAPELNKPAQDDVMKALHQMSLGIVSELQKPGPRDDTQKSAPLAALAQPAEPAAPAPVAAASQLYTVQQGESLAGISYRFYGNTVGYLTILQANTDLLSSPADVRAGMVLTIPETP